MSAETVITARRKTVSINAMQMARQEAERAIATAIQKEMNKFHDLTGVVVSGMTIETKSIERSIRGRMLLVGMVLTDVRLHTPV